MRGGASRGYLPVLGLTLAIAVVLAIASVPAFGGPGNADGKGRGHQDIETDVSVISSCAECLVGEPVSFSGVGFDPSKDVATFEVGEEGSTVPIASDGTIFFQWVFSEPGVFEVRVYQGRNGRPGKWQARTTVSVVSASGDPAPGDDITTPTPTTSTIASTTTTSTTSGIAPTSTTTSTTTAPPTSGFVLPQPPADGTTDDVGGRFRVSCDFSHRAQVDPIVGPFQPSHHMHDFFGNTLTSDDPSYSRMLSGGSSCGLSADTAAYWFPSLRAPDGSFVEPDEFLFYYRARPVGYEYGTHHFPPNFKMIAGGVGAPDTAAYWTCKGESDTGYSDRKTFIPDCTGVEEERLVAHVFFPSCWDGVNLDSADHRAHVAYGLNDGEVVSTNPDTCPATHPYKIPQLDLRVVYPITDGTGYQLADGSLLPHADFWNTWQQNVLEELIDRCLRTGENCGGISD